MQRFYFTLMLIFFTILLYSCNNVNSNSQCLEITTYESSATQTDYEEITQVTTSETPAPFIMPDSYSIDVDYIYQCPELPTGCEITSLTMLLNYLGFDVSKTDLADNYLEKDYMCTVSFNDAFIGDPRWDGGYGCFSPVIVRSAQKYLDTQHNGYKYLVENISGTKFEDLYEYIANDNPVIIWCSMSLMDIYKNYCYTASDGNDVYWYDNEHCMLLTGYDKNEGTVTAADPLEGLMLYNSERFEYIYNQLGKQAVIIRKNK